MKALKALMERNKVHFEGVQIKVDNDDSYITATVNVEANYHRADRSAGIMHNYLELNSIEVLSFHIENDQGHFVTQLTAELSSDDIHELEVEIQETFLNLK